MFLRMRKKEDYIDTDGSFIAIRYMGWKEIKLGEIFKDTRIINAGKERHIVVEKDYTAVESSAEEFKEFHKKSAYDFPLYTHKHFTINLLFSRCRLVFF
jgi:hypothetical protein